MGLILTPVLQVLRAVPIWAYALVALLTWGGWQRHVATTATRAAEQAVAQQRVDAAARAQEFEFADKARKAADEYRTNLAHVSRSAGAASAALGGLLDSLPGAIAAAASAATTGRIDGSTNVGLVVGQCVRTVQTVAEAADACEQRLSGLQAYVKATR